MSCDEFYPADWPEQARAALKRQHLRVVTVDGRPAESWGRATLRIAARRLARDLLRAITIIGMMTYALAGIIVVSALNGADQDQIGVEVDHTGMFLTGLGMGALVMICAKATQLLRQFAPPTPPPLYQPKEPDNAA
jgi:hypothetical protein